MLLECPALADLRDEFSPLNASAQVSWLGLGGPWSGITLLHVLIECHDDDEQTLFHPFSLVGCQRRLNCLPETNACSIHKM